MRLRLPVVEVHPRQMGHGHVTGSVFRVANDVVRIRDGSLSRLCSSLAMYSGARPEPAAAPAPLHFRHRS
jgi:hypothetical protein